MCIIQGSEVLCFLVYKTRDGSQHYKLLTQFCQIASAFSGRVIYNSENSVQFSHKGPCWPGVAQGSNQVGSICVSHWPYCRAGWGHVEHQPGVQAWISRAMACTDSCTPGLWVGHGAAGQPPLKSSFWGKESQPSLRFRLASQDLSPRPLALLFPSWPCTRAAKPVGEGQIMHTFHLQWLPARLVWGGIPAY